MKTLNNSTKAAKRFINAYYNSNATTLSDVYGRFSTRKASAERYCRELMHKENGNDFRIVSAGSCFFSCGWVTAAGLRIETPQSSYFIPAQS